MDCVVLRKKTLNFDFATFSSDIDLICFCETLLTNDVTSSSADNQDQTPRSLRDERTTPLQMSI